MSEEWKTGTVSLKLGGNTYEMEMTVPATPVKPQRMLPILQRMTSAFVDASVADGLEPGEEISCKAGCGACCRQPVPISEVEVYQIAELVEAMPEPRRSVIKKRFADGVEHFRRTGWFDKMNTYHGRGEPKASREEVIEALNVAMEYFHEGVPCPFLEDESCSIHPDRPLACREYLVTSPAENCRRPSAESIRRIELLARPATAVRSFGKTGALDGSGLLTLIRALELAEAHPQTPEEKTGEQWMGEFLSTMAQQDAAAKAAAEA